MNSSAKNRCYRCIRKSGALDICLFVSRTIVRHGVFRHLDDTKWNWWKLRIRADGKYKGYTMYSKFKKFFCFYKISWKLKKYLKIFSQCFLYNFSIFVDLYETCPQLLFLIPMISVNALQAHNLSKQKSVSRNRFNISSWKSSMDNIFHQTYKSVHHYAEVIRRTLCARRTLSANATRVPGELGVAVNEPGIQKNASGSCTRSPAASDRFIGAETQCTILKYSKEKSNLPPKAMDVRTNQQEQICRFSEHGAILLKILRIGR